MNNDFKTLVTFLDAFEPEVSGRIYEPPHPEAAQQLGRFAVGEVGKSERATVCAMLQLHPAWVRYLAERVIESRLGGPEEEEEEEA